MISTEVSLKHMAWSNQLIFEEVSKLPEEIYGLKAAEGEWPVGKILTHLDRKSTRLNSSHVKRSRMPSSA